MSQNETTIVCRKCGVVGTHHCSMPGCPLPPLKDAEAQSNTTEPRMKWVRELSREEAALDRLGWRAIAQETRLDSSVWRLWADMEDTDGR